MYAYPCLRDLWDSCPGSFIAKQRLQAVSKSLARVQVVGKSQIVCSKIPTAWKAPQWRMEPVRLVMVSLEIKRWGLTTNLDFDVIFITAYYVCNFMLLHGQAASCNTSNTSAQQKIKEQRAQALQ